MKLFTSAAVYSAIVFGSGFVFGTVRVMWLVPTVGVRVAELTELPLMLAVVFFAARWVNRRFLIERDQSARLIVGVVAFALLRSAFGPTIESRVQTFPCASCNRKSGTA
jgi:hypothetical protein